MSDTIEWGEVGPNDKVEILDHTDWFAGYEGLEPGQVGVCVDGAMVFGSPTNLHRWAYHVQRALEDYVHHLSDLNTGENDE